MKKLLIAAALAASLSGCAAINSTLGDGEFNPDETLDQFGHYALGKLLARDIVKYTDTKEEAVEFVMVYARAREEVQHPGSCKEGCQLDLRLWEAGARKGAGLD